MCIKRYFQTSAQFANAAVLCAGIGPFEKLVGEFYAYQLDQSRYTKQGVNLATFIAQPKNFNEPVAVDLFCFKIHNTRNFFSFYFVISKFFINFAVAFEKFFFLFGCKINIYFLIMQIFS